MSKSFRASAVRLALAGAAVALGVAGTAAGVAAASAAPARHIAQPPPVDHQLCYTAAGLHFRVPSGVRLIDQFSPNGFVPRISPTQDVHCNPVEKILPTEKIVGAHVFPVINPAMHLLCFPVPFTPVITKVWDENQFGTSVVHIRATKWLCVPSTKKIVG